MQFNTADMDLKQSDSALVPGPKAFHLCSAFISQRGSSRWGNQMHSVSQWQQTGQPSCLLLQLVKFICQFFESGLGSSTSTQLGHKEGGEAEESVSWIAGSYSIVIFFEKEKNRCILGNPWLPMRESQAHTQPVSHGGENTYDTRSLGSGRWKNNSKIRKDQPFRCAVKENGSRWWEMFPGTTAEQMNRTVILTVSVTGTEGGERLCVSGGLNSAWQWVYDECMNMQVWRRYKVWRCVCVSVCSAVWYMHDLFWVEWSWVRIRS